MTKIIIRPLDITRNYDPADLEVSITREKAEDGSSIVKKFRLTNKNFIPNADLQPNDTIRLTYKGIDQLISLADNPRYTHVIDPAQLANPDHTITLIIHPPENSELNPVSIESDVNVNLKSFGFKEPLEIRLTPTSGGQTKDQALWDTINSHKLNFKHYSNFIDEVLRFEGPGGKGRAYFNSGSPTTGSKKDKLSESQQMKLADSMRLPFNRTEAYSLLKFATERYVEHVYSLARFADEYSSNEDSFDLNDYLGKDKIIPYYDLIKAKIKEYFIRTGAESGYLRGNADANLIELIWNYWHEEGKVSQTMNALARRFQNIKNGYKDPLLNFALDPLRPLNHILWGYIQDQQHRLTATRKNYEYTSEYDLAVLGNVKPGFNPADRRSKFLQSFHRLIHEATEYFVQSDNTTIRPDGFKLLNALRDTHRILAEGAHNQFGDLPTVARIETLIEQWILSRPEVREFLGGRIMVPYEEPWMDRVDSMKALQGWDNTSISFYRDLAVNGEKIILGIRYGNWTNVSSRDHATNWADAFRDAIQRYIHSYYTVTGIDLSTPTVNINPEVSALLPGLHIYRRLNREKQRFSRRF